VPGTANPEDLARGGENGLAHRSSFLARDAGVKPC
jgi:hypothetical protein